MRLTPAKWTVIALSVLLLAGSASAQFHATVKGVAKDTQGQPIVDAKVRFQNTEDGSKSELKTNKKGEFFSIAVRPGKYDIALISKDGKELFKLNGVPITMQVPENVVDFDLQKEAARLGGGQQQQQQASSTAQPPAGGSGGAAPAPAAPAQDPNQPIILTEEQKKKLSPEKLKQYEEYEKTVKENEKIRGMNEVLKQAQAASKAGNPEQAVQMVSGLAQQAPDKPVLWAVLGQYQSESAKKQTDSAARRAKYGEAAASFEKAVKLAETSTDPQAQTDLATWRMGYAAALGGAGKPAEAEPVFAASAQQLAAANPKQAAIAHFNAGVMAFNTGKVDNAVAHFDKAIAADPAYAEAYYQKGTALIAKATADKSGKIVAPPGTEEALEKYLELAPAGPNATAAEEQLKFLGKPVKRGVRNK